MAGHARGGTRGPRRWIILAAVMLIELLLGFQYTWGIFDRALQENHGFAATETQAVLGAQIVLYSVTFFAAGWVLHRFGPRVTTLIGGVLYGSSLIIGGTFGQNPPALFWGTGVLFGVGLAFCYISPLVTVVKWFPRYKGVATGLVVAFYGGGSFVLAGIAKYLLAHGFSAFRVLNIFGIAGICGISLMALVLRDPPGAEGDERRVRFPKGVLKTGHFWSLVVGFFAGTCAGISIIGSLERIGRTIGTPEWWLGLSVMALALGNTTGRIAWGILTDILGTRVAVALSLAGQSACIIAMVFFGNIGAAFVALAFVIGFNYGANFVLYVCDVSKAYGADRVGSVFALVNFGYLASGFIGPPSAGLIYDTWNTYVPAMCAAAALTFLGAAVFLLLHRHGHPGKPAAAAAAP